MKLEQCPCTACNSTGQCGYCNGSGGLPCACCNATGNEIDSNGQTVICHCCNGSGKIFCRNCNGSGKCGTCHGSGQVPCK